MVDDKKIYITHLPHATSPAHYQRALCGQLAERRHILRPNDLRPLRCLACARVRDRAAAETVKPPRLKPREPA